jgi:hypothetical protein
VKRKAWGAFSYKMRHSVKKLPLILFVLLLAACSSQEPTIEVTDLHDFGVVTKGEVATVELPVRNSGRAPLIIEQLVTTCGCTSASITETTILPGEEATLTVSYDSAAHETDMGALERRIFIISNVPDDADKMIRFLVMVEP